MITNPCDSNDAFDVIFTLFLSISQAHCQKHSSKEYQSRLALLRTPKKGVQKDANGTGPNQPDSKDPNSSTMQDGSPDKEAGETPTK